MLNLHHNNLIILFIFLSCEIHNFYPLFHYVYICFCLLKGNSKPCNMAASTEVPTVVPVGGAMPSASTKEYLTDEEFFCDESMTQPPVVCICYNVCVSNIVFIRT